MFQIDGGVIAIKDGLGCRPRFKRSAILPPTGISLGLGDRQNCRPPASALASGDRRRQRPPSRCSIPTASQWRMPRCRSPSWPPTHSVGFSESDARKFAKTTRQKITATPAGPVVGKMQVPLPKALQKRLSAVTDRDGNAVLVGIARSEIAGVEVLSEKYGTQGVSRMFADYLAVGPGQAALDEFPATISLRPVGSVSGRLVADGGGGGGIPLADRVVRVAGVRAGW